MNKKIEKWLRDERFVDYVDGRILHEINNVPENHCLTPEYDGLADAFDRDGKYIIPLVAYLSYRLQLARLQKETRKGKRAVWWVFVQAALLGNYTQTTFLEFDILQVELMDTVLPILHGEYIQKSNKKKR